MGYQDLLRVGLRHRPDIFIIGEIRDPETAQIAVRAALSGHLVLATVHARSAWGVVSRLKELGIADHYLEQTLNTICYQRLLPLKDGQQAVLFDLLSGSPLVSQLGKHHRGGMSDEWQTALQTAKKAGTISTETATQYSAG